MHTKIKGNTLSLLFISAAAIIFLTAATYSAVESVNAISKESEAIYSRAAGAGEYDNRIEQNISNIRTLKDNLKSRATVLCIAGAATLLVINIAAAFKSGNLFSKAAKRGKSDPEYIKSTVNILNSNAKQIREFSKDFSRNTDSQINDIQNILSDVEICAYQTEMDGKNATIVGNVSSEAKDAIAVCSEEMTQMLSAMKNIKESSDNISKIIKIIDDIAMQTNLLSLNAAVEAVHGGEYGKSFAVVAGEVRNLALKSQKAVSDTTVLIKESLERVDNGTAIATKTAESLSKIVERVNRIYDLMTEINNSTDIQAQAFSRVNKGLDKMSESVKNSSAAIVQNASISGEIEEHCRSIGEILSE